MARLFSFLILGVLLITAVSLQAQSKASYALVKLYESVGKSGEIVISYGAEGDKAESIPVGSLSTDSHKKNSNQLVKVFNRMAKEGYKLVSSNSSSHGNAASILHVETFVFIKED